MGPFVGEEERELGRVKFTYYKKANKQNRSTFMYITYWRSRLAPRRLSNQQLSILFDERARC